MYYKQAYECLCSGSAFQRCYPGILYRWWHCNTEVLHTEKWAKMCVFKKWKHPVHVHSHLPLRLCLGNKLKRTATFWSSYFQWVTVIRFWNEESRASLNGKLGLALFSRFPMKNSLKITNTEWTLGMLKGPGLLAPVSVLEKSELLFQKMDSS